MVRLKGRAAGSVRTALRFQFHYGTIKSPVRASVRASRCLFQFHYGTIKRRGGRQALLPGMRFQFHYGTIKSQLRTTITATLT